MYGLISGLLFYSIGLLVCVCASTMLYLLVYSENYKTLKKTVEVEKPPMFMDQQNSYCENGYDTKSNLQIQLNDHQNSNGILHKTRKNNATT
jgi:hypothetical protein